MKMSASIISREHHHEILVQTDESTKAIQIQPKPTGFGSSVNGGELLLLSLATCFCNDIYREASNRGIPVSGVEVTGHFGQPGEAGSHFTYKTTVVSDAPAAEVAELIRYTDRIAEVHNTLRQGIDIKLIS
jgi:uncharacterized OsmC-like protein